MLSKLTTPPSPKPCHQSIIFHISWYSPSNFLNHFKCSKTNTHSHTLPDSPVTHLSGFSTMIFIFDGCLAFIIFLFKTIMFYFYVPDSKPQMNFYLTNYTQICPPKPTHHSSSLVEPSALGSQIDSLTSEVRLLRAHCQTQFVQTQEALTQLRLQLSTIRRVVEVEKPKKVFQKGIKCGVDNCGKSYSSRIALNCHIRHKHPSKCSE